MPLIDEQFPVCISFGSIGAPEFSNDVVDMDDGTEQILERWPTGRHKYNAKTGIKTKTDYHSVLSLMHACRARSYYFRWKDWQDYSTGEPITHTDCELVDNTGAIALGDGSTTDFYLATKYTFGSETVYRPITLPVVSTIKIGKNTTLQTIAIDYTIEQTADGIYFVRFATAPALNDDLTCGMDFDVPARLNADWMPANIANKTEDELLVLSDVMVIEKRLVLP